MGRALVGRRVVVNAVVPCGHCIRCQRGDTHLCAKRQVFGQVGIDMIAGPSEVLVLADKTGNPDWIAADLLAQAEHDESAQSILITDDAALADAVDAAPGITSYTSTQLAGLAAGLFAADAPFAGNEKVLEMAKTFKGRGVQADDTPPSTPAEALKKFTPRKGLAVDLLAADLHRARRLLRRQIRIVPRIIRGCPL